MSVRERGNTWQVYVRAGDHRIRESFKTQVEAINREAELKLAFATGKALPVPDRSDRRLTLAQLYRRTCETVWKGQKAEAKTMAKGKLVVQYFGGGRFASEITTRDVNDYVRNLETAGNSNATINRKVSALSKMLRLAKDEGYLLELPKFKRQREGGGRIRFLTDEEEAALLATCRVWGVGLMHDLIVFLTDTGARVSEALRLEWQDVQPGRVTFWDTKNNTPRSVPLTGRVKAMLAERRQSEGMPFAVDYDTVHQAWEKLRTHLGTGEDKQFVLHMLRHTCASRLVQRGASIVKVKEWLGHKSIQITMRYAHLAPTSLDDLASLLEREPVLRRKPSRIASSRAVLRLSLSSRIRNGLVGHRHIVA